MRRRLRRSVTGHVQSRSTEVVRPRGRTLHKPWSVTGCAQRLSGSARVAAEARGNSLPLAAQQRCSCFGNLTSPFHSPTGPRHFQPLGSDLLASALHRSTADPQPLRPILRIAHPLPVVGVVSPRLPSEFTCLRVSKTFLKGHENLLKTTLPQIAADPFSPRLTFRGVLSKDRTRDGGNILHCVVPVHDLDRFRIVIVHQVPYPRRPIADENQLRRLFR